MWNMKFCLFIIHVLKNELAYKSFCAIPNQIPNKHTHWKLSNWMNTKLRNQLLQKLISKRNFPCYAHFRQSELFHFQIIQFPMICLNDIARWHWLLSFLIPVSSRSYERVRWNFSPNKKKLPGLLFGNWL